MVRVSQALYPLWLIAANLMARFGGMIVLLILGHGFAPDLLGQYFAALAMIGLTVTAAQAGTAPLLIRLWQAGETTKCALQVAFRFLIAVSAVCIVARTLPNGANSTVLPYWPLFLMPLAAAITPDWVLSARQRFSSITLITLAAQSGAIATAITATISQNSTLLFAVAPSISIIGLITASLLAFRRVPPGTTAYSIAAPNGKAALGLVGFTLLVGMLPNLDFVLLSPGLVPAGQTDLFLTQRIFLLSAALLGSISAALFARPQTGIMRDVWLILPFALVSLTLLLIPDGIASLIYRRPSGDLIELLRLGAFWPLLLALLNRQILMLQEHAENWRTGWFCLFVLAATAMLVPSGGHAGDIMLWMQARLAICLTVLCAFRLHTARREVLP